MSVDQVVRIVRSQAPDVIVSDVMFHGRPDGLDLPAMLAAANLGAIPVLFLSSYDMPYFIQRARDAGAVGYLPKTSKVSTLVHAIGLAAAGQTTFPARMQGARRPSAREIEVMRLVAAGLTNSQIGSRLGLSARTVDGHLLRLCTRYVASGRVQLVVLAIQNGWVAPRAMDESSSLA